MRNAASLAKAEATFLRPSAALLLSLADPAGNSIRRNEPDRTDVVDRGNEATCLDLVRATRTGFSREARVTRGVRWGFSFCNLLVMLERLVTTLRAAAGVLVGARGGAGGGRATVRAIFFCLRALETGGKGGGSGALGTTRTVFTAGGTGTLRCLGAAILGGGGGAIAMAGRRDTVAGGGGATVLRVLV